jgi:hypothetical protein
MRRAYRGGVRSPGQLLPPILVAALAAATIVEALAALRVFAPVGREPGDAPFILDVAHWTALLALVAAAIVCARAVFARSSSRWMALLAPLGGAALLVHALGYDPYTAPILIRFTQEESRGNHLWLVGVAIAGVAAGLLSRRFRRTGAALSALVLLVTAGTFLLVGAGH